MNNFADLTTQKVVLLHDLQWYHRRVLPSAEIFCIPRLFVSLSAIYLLLLYRVSPDLAFKTDMDIKIYCHVLIFKMFKYLKIPIIWVNRYFLDFHFHSFLQLLKYNTSLCLAYISFWVRSCIPNLMEEEFRLYISRSPIWLETLVVRWELYKITQLIFIVRTTHQIWERRFCSCRIPRASHTATQ